MPGQLEEKLSLWNKVRIHRNVITFWFLGLANNYGYVVMLSAAHDILAEFDRGEPLTSNKYQRECNTMSTGIILIADIMPSILIKIFSPFVPLYIHARMTITIGLSVLGFVLVALKIYKWTVILGVVCMSLSCGLGETSLLSYVVFFKTKNVISTWSSGTGGAGIVGATSYAGLTAMGFSPVFTLLAMLVVPVLQGVCFFICIDHPNIETKSLENTHKKEPIEADILIHKSDTKPIDNDDEKIPIEADMLTFSEKLRTIPHLLVTYMAPFGLVYLFEYFINQGLFELLYFPDAHISHAEQYRWYSVLYQIGVFISRSSMNLIQIDHIWLIAILQFANVLFCILEVFYGFVKYVPLLMGLIFWEGLVGGASYVNTYRRIASETPPEARQFCMAMNTFADALMITCAGILAFPAHNILCSYPSPYSNV